MSESVISRENTNNKQYSIDVPEFAGFIPVAYRHPKLGEYFLIESTDCLIRSVHDFERLKALIYKETN